MATSKHKISSQLQPGRDCSLCERLVAFRHEARINYPDWHNAPVPSFGPENARVLIVGLAPGLRGANRTGRPFTGDWAGDLLYETLLDYGFASGVYEERPDDNLKLIDCRVTNAVRCVPPENKPTPAEIRACRPFLESTLATMPKLQIIVALGRIAHESVVRAFAMPLAKVPFGHGAKANLLLPDGRPIQLFDSYHCSRYNTNTGVLTPEMFRKVFANIRKSLESA